MKHRFIILQIVVFVIFSLSCTWKIPTAVEIKTNPEYEFNLGSLELPLGDKLKTSVQSQITLQSDTISSFIYEPADDNLFHLLVYCPIEEIDFNFANEITDLSLVDDLENTLPDFSYTIPENSTPLEIAEKTLPTIPSGVDSLNPYTVTITLPELVSTLSENGFVEGVIAEGSIDYDFTLNGLDGTGWNYTIDSINVSIVQSEGLSIDQSFNGFATGEKNPSISVNLAGKTVNSNELTFSGTMTITFKNVGSGTPSYSCVMSSSLEKFTSVTLEVTDEYESEVSISQPPSDNMLEYVNYIDFTKIGLDIAYTNQLPEGNNIGVILTSTLFGIDNTVSLTGAEGTTFVGDEYTSPYKRYTPNAETPIDFTASIVLPGYNEDYLGKKVFVLNNVTAGTTLAFSTDISMVTDWDKISIVPKSESVVTSQTLPSITNELLGENSDVTFNGVESYIYYQTPSEKIELVASVKASSGDVEKTITIEEYGFPELTYDTTDETIVKSFNASEANRLDLSELLTPNPIVFDCTIEVTAIDLTPTDLETSTTFGAYTIIDIPFDISTEKDITIDLMESTGEANDNNATDDSFIDIFEYLESAELTLAYDNKTGINFKVNVQGLKDTSQEFSFVNGENDIVLTMDNASIQHIANNRLADFGGNVVFPAGDFSIQRNPSMSLSILAKLNVAIDETISLTNEGAN